MFCQVGQQAPGQPYTGTGPLDWAATTARLGAEIERSLADEAGGPLAQLLPVPQDGGADDEGDPLRGLKADIRAARGRAVMVETVTAAGWGEGASAAPRQDWKPQRLGPAPGAGLPEAEGQAFLEVLGRLWRAPGHVPKDGRFGPARSLSEMGGAGGGAPGAIAGS